MWWSKQDEYLLKLYSFGRASAACNPDYWTARFVDVPRMYLVSLVSSSHPATSPTSLAVSTAFVYKPSVAGICFQSIKRVRRCASHNLEIPFTVTGSILNTKAQHLISPFAFSLHHLTASMQVSEMVAKSWDS